MRKKGLIILSFFVILFWTLTLLSLYIVEVLIMNYVNISFLRTILGFLIYIGSVFVWYMTIIKVVEKCSVKSG